MIQIRSLSVLCLLAAVAIFAPAQQTNTPAGNSTRTSMKAKEKANQTKSGSARIESSGDPHERARETGSGMASGKATVTTARETGSGMATGRRAATTPRESGSGMATGKAAVTTSRETGSGMATGRRTATDDRPSPQAPTPVGSQGKPKRPSTVVTPHEPQSGMADGR